MINPMTKYYDVNRLLLLICGLWPYEKSKFRYIQAIFYITIILSFIVFQFMTLIDADYSINLITKLLSIVLPMCVCLLKYGAFLYNNQKMKHLMDLIWYHWSIIQDKQEVAILKKYTKFSRRFTLFMLHIFSLSIFVIIMGHMLPMILDIIIPLNSSRPRHFYMIMEYFIDQERYFLWLLLHTSMTLLVAALMVLSIGTMLMSCVFHACAMFKIASYRIRDAMTENPVKVSSFQKYHLIHKKLTNGIHIHWKAMEFTDLITCDFKISYFILLATGVASLALNIFQVFISLSTSNVNELFTTFTFVLAHFCYLYVGNHAGQIVTDHHVDVFNATCRSYWYTAPLRAQKLLLFIMQRTSKNFSFVFGGIFVVSLKGFSTLASMSISYFTVIYSMIYSR